MSNPWLTSSSSNPWSGSSSSNPWGAPSKSAAAKSVDSGWFGGDSIFSYLLNTGKGMASGAWELSKAGVGDTLHAASLGAIGDEFKSDDIAAGIKDAYMDMYAPAFRGDFDTTWEKMKADPIAPLLDVLGLVSMGGAAVGRGAATGAKTAGTAAGAAKAAKVAGLKEYGRFKPGDSSSKATLLEDAILADRERPGFHTVRGKNDVIVNDKTGQVFIPDDVTLKAGVLDGGKVSLSLDRRAHRNPIKRGYQKGFNKFSNAAPALKAVGSERRIARYDNKMLKGRVSNEMGSLESPRVIAHRASVDADDAKQLAMDLLSKGVTPLQARKYYEQKLKRFDDVGEEKLSHVQKQYDKVQGMKESIEAMGRRLDDQNIEPSIKNLVRAYDESIVAMSDEVRRLDPKKQMPDIDALEASMRTHRDVRRLMVAKKYDTLSEAAKNLGRMSDDLGDTLKGAPHVEIVQGQLRDRIMRLKEKAVQEVFANPTKDMQIVMDWEKAATSTLRKDGFITNSIKKAGIEPDPAKQYQFLESVLGRVLDEGEISEFTGWKRPERAAVDSPSNVVGGGLVNKKFADEPLGSPRSTQSMRENTGYAVRMAMNDLSTENVGRAVKEAEAYRLTQERLKHLIGGSQPIPTNGVIPDGWAVFNDPKLLNHAQSILDGVDEHLRPVFGEHPQLDVIEDLLGKGIAKKVEGGRGVMIPQKYLDILTEEFTRGKYTLEKLIAKPTGFFRFATLNSRPAWLVNNFVGQLMLTMMSQGIVRGAAIYFRELRKAAVDWKATRLNPTSGMDDIAQQTGSLTMRTLRLQEQQIGIDAAFNDRMLEVIKSPKKANTALGRGFASLGHLMYRPGKFMENVNAVLTDDIPRRAVFKSELDKAAKPLVDAGMDHAQAVERLMKSEKFVDTLSTKVLDDLIDYGELSAMERAWIRPLLPFWSWIRGMTKLTGRHMLEHHERAWMMAQVGNLGVRTTDEKMGDIPEWMRGSIVLGDNEDGTRNILTTVGINPFQTPVDLLESVGALGADGEAGRNNELFSMGNPVIKSVAEGMSGTDFFTGQDLSRKYPNTSVGMQMLNQYTGSLAPWRLAQNTVRAESLSPEDEAKKLYTSSHRNKYLQYLGLPLRAYRPEAAAKISGL